MLSFIGLLTKAGNVGSGEFSTEKAIKSGKAYLVIIAKDASENTKKKFKNMCSFYRVPIRCFGEKETLGKGIGKEFRASLVILEENMAKSLLEKIDSEEEIQITEGL